MPSSLQVRVDGRESASLFREADHRVLRYADVARQQDVVSLTMPVRRQDYVHQRMLRALGSTIGRYGCTSHGWQLPWECPECSTWNIGFAD